MNNKQINKVVLVAMVLLSLLGAQFGNAQKSSGIKDKTPEERAQFQTALMKDKLGLDSSQVEQVQVINLKYAQKTEPVLNSEGGKLSKFKQLKAIQQDKDKELKGVLDGDQFKQYGDFKKEMMTRLKDEKQQE